MHPISKQKAKQELSWVSLCRVSLRICCSNCPSHLLKFPMAFSHSLSCLVTMEEMDYIMGFLLCSGLQCSFSLFDGFYFYQWFRCFCLNFKISDCLLPCAGRFLLSYLLHGSLWMKILPFLLHPFLSTGLPMEWYFYSTVVFKSKD